MGGQDNSLRLSDNSKPVEDPLDLVIGSSSFGIVKEENLITEYGCGHLCLIIFKSAMPSVFIEVEAAFKPLIEWLDGLAASVEEFLSQD